ncbi:hypothetical protein [Tenacibaculum sp. C7A-26P2]|uniref:hypothetical protein n=1 Tax=Tenacibaculum sp. C7A-26P2 TaxID=3447504 RepID=UPI003F84BA25
MKKALILLSFLCFQFTNSQNCIKGKIKELKNLTDKPLAVILLKENKKLIEKLEKKIAKNNKKKEKFQEQLNDYRNHISYFNTNIKEVITTYWKLNNTDNIKYFTKEELKNAKTSQYAVLDLTPENVNVNINDIGSRFMYYYSLDVQIITYGSSENKRHKASYKNHLTNVSYNTPGYADKELKKAIERLIEERKNGPKLLSKENMIASVILSQKYIEKVLTLNDKISFQEFAEEEMKKNCKELEGKNILFQETIVHGKIKNSLKDLLPKANIELVSANRIAQAFINEEDILVAFPIVKRLQKSKGKLSGFSLSTVIPITHKIIINTKSKEIIGFVEHSGMTSYTYFKKNDFKKLNEQCK